jgi:hypothetical protein
LSTQQAVDAFLTQVRQWIANGDTIFVTRTKNVETLTALGLTQVAAVQDLANLTSENYSSGPEPDRDRPAQQCWIFGYEVLGLDLYVKLVPETLPDGRPRLRVLSYHEAAFPLARPLKRTT